MKTRFIAAAVAALTIVSAYGQTFERKAFVGPGSNYSGQYGWVDFNADGKLDFLEVDFYGGPTLHISEGAGTKTVALSTLSVYFEEGRYAFNDYDGDGDVDILTVKEGAIVIANYDGDESFTLLNTGITFTYPEIGKIFWVDLDGDLVLDIIHGRKVFLNHQGIYEESPEMLPDMLSGTVLDDINSDGLPDIVAGGYDLYDGTDVSIYVNTGGGHFKQTAAPTLPVSKLKSSSITLLDADGDSDIDVFAIDQYARGFIFRNSLVQTGQMTFTSQQIATNISLFRALAGDINFDGSQDLVGVSPSAVVVLKNTSTGTSVSFAQETYEQNFDMFYSAALVDLNGDNKLDVHVKAYSHQNGYENLNFENKGAIVGAAPATPTNPASIVEKNVALSWTAIAGRLYNIEVKRNGTIYKSSATSPSGKLLLAERNFLVRNGSLILRELPAGSYEWRVQALDPSGRSSAFSLTNTFTVKGGPSSLTLQATDLTKVKLCWSYAGGDNPSFRIFRAPTSGPAIEIAQVGAGIYCYNDNAVPDNQIVKYYVVAASGSNYSAPSNTVVHHSSMFIGTLFGTVDPNIIDSRVFAADYDMDGDYDLEFIGRISSSDNNYLLKNNGTGTFTPHGSILPGTSIKLPQTPMAGPRDLDNDGDPDIVVITGDDYSWQKISVYLNNNGTFTTGFETPEYMGILQLIVEDLNNDGRPDLLFSYTLGNSPSGPRQIKLLYQKADGGFEDSRITFIGTETSAYSYFKCADLNNDGFLDLLAFTPDKPNLEILVNEAGTGFTKRTTALPPTYEWGIADYTGDGIVDLMLLGNEGLQLYFGAGDFKYTEPKVIPIEFYTSGPVYLTADIDLNGLPDLLLTDGYASHVLLNKGNGSFKDAEMKFIAYEGASLAITDFENDGDLDLVKVGNDGQHQGLNYLYKNQAANLSVVNAPPAAPTGLTAVYDLGKATFSWSAASDDRTPVKLLTYNLKVTDSNGKVWLSPETNDAGTFRRRLGAGNTGYSTTKTLNNLPAGQYTVRVQALDASFKLSPWSQQVQVTILSGPTALAVERVLLNKVKLTWVGTSFVETKVIVQRRTVETNWKVVAELPAGGLTFTDSNLEYNELFEYRVMESSGTVTTASSNVAEWSTNMWVLQDTDIANISGSMDIADFTGDGKMDMVLNGSMIYDGSIQDITRATFENTATGWVKRDLPESDATSTAQILFADMNSDIKPDIYQHGYNWNVGYKTETFINTGNKTFNSTANVFTENSYGIPFLFDFDMDNDPDITVAKANTYPVERDVYRNDGGGNYSLVDMASCRSCTASGVVADFDRDGDEDIIRSTGNDYQLFLNTPQGLLSAGISFPGYENSIAVTDYNADGWPDVMQLTSSYYTHGKLFKNLGLDANGAIQFEETAVDLSSGYQSTHSADFDHDGNTDLVILSPQVQVLLNKGDDTFQQYIEPSFNVGQHVAGVIDFDNDGDLDIYFSGYHIKDRSYYGRKGKILLNQTIVSGTGVRNMPPAAPTGLSSTQDASGVHLSWSAPADDHTLAEGITYDVVLFRDGKAITKAPHDPTTGRRLRLAAGKSSGVSTLNNLSPGPYTYRVQAIDASLAASDFSAEATFVYLPAPPVVNDTLIYACGRTITIAAKGSDMKWYRDPELTQLVASGEFHPTETQTVYAAQTISGYQGIPKRVEITIVDKPDKPVFLQSNPYPICEGPGLRSLWVQGEGVHWYSNEGLTTELSNTNNVEISMSAATYYATQKIGGCESDPLAVKVEPVSIDSKLYYTGDKIWTTETEGDYYTWYRNGYYYRSTTDPYIPFDGQQATYVVMINKGWCSEYSEPFVSSPENITAVEEILELSFEVFPNPASSNLTLRSKRTNTTIGIFDAMGKMVYLTALNANGEHKVDVTRWSKGVYVIVGNDGTNVYKKRLVLY